MSYTRIARLRTAAQFAVHLSDLGINLPFDETVIPAPDGPLARPYSLQNGRLIGNRFCVLPMEGWDGTRDGRPTSLTHRRWANFGRSGAKLVWGGEAVAARPDGRANPNQLMLNEDTLPDIEKLRQTLVQAHVAAVGQSDDLQVGLQLTQSGRFCRPNDKKKLEPRLVYHHPFLDKLYDIPPDLPVLSDGELDEIAADFIKTAVLAHAAGFDFVDVKHCHGYLAHELLSARARPGKYGGSFANRTRFLRQIIAGIRREAPGLMIGARLSAFDFPPFRATEPGGKGQSLFRASDNQTYSFAFGADPANPLQPGLEETTAFLTLLQEQKVELVCITAGSPYYNPHIQRPALFPPSDGYAPPTDPLVDVARQINVTAALKRQFPGLAFVGSAYSYLQEWLPRVAQGVVARGMADFVGLGRMMLSYPEMPSDVLAGRPLARKNICRTFSDCTTAPRHGLVSGCYPLDAAYKTRPEAVELAAIKEENLP
jgi:2,4-dienoyl-CoA reductase-like NADH-dependent reductase (Old Yellow Enzyme family)